MIALSDIWLVLVPLLYVVSKWLYEFTSVYYPPKDIAKEIKK